jgi:hypothetical protein
MVETTNGNLPAELSIYTSVAEFPTPNKTPATSARMDRKGLRAS